MPATRLLVLSTILCAAAAHADAVFTGKLSLTGMYYTENDGTTNPQDNLATTSNLGYVELRTLLEGKRLWHDRLDIRIDLRLRFTGSLDFGNTFTPAALTQDPLASLGTSAQGYLGGSEYDLRQAYALLRLTEPLSLQLGRMYVYEADALKIDGVRLLRKFGPHWEGSLFAGGYPNPYSRSVLTDYTAPCGAGVAQVNPTPTVTSPALEACQPGGAQFGIAGGLSAKYTYGALWGSAALVGAFFDGPGGGGPVVPQTTSVALPAGGNQLLAAASTSLDAPRIYINWMNSWRPLERLDLFANLVVDLYGSNGPQLTRVVALGTLHLLKDNRLTLRLGYSHLSSLDIDMYLNRLLYNRVTGITLSNSALSAVENNLTVLQTGRDEGRVTAELRLVRRLGLYFDGRFRGREVLDGSSNPTVYNSATYTSNTADLAYDATFGLRDGGSLGGVRAGLAYTYLQNFRAQNHVLGFDLGRDFLGERLNFDFNYVLAVTSDSGAGQSNLNCSATSPFLVGCFGQRDGLTHEVGAVVTVNPWKRLFILADYRFTALLTNSEMVQGLATPIPTVLSHSILGRVEFRW